MKNKLLIFLLTIILFFQTGFVFAENLIDWKEICPAQYQNAKYHHQFYKTQKTLGVLCIMSLYGIGLGIPMLALADTVHTSNYWALRKKEYDKKVAECNISNNKTMCYMQIREDELRKSTEHSINTVKVKDFDSSDFY
ncbi:MAG: hypothetical protein WC197_05990 [Candidatus Gastranaerophilaceae bacterium]|jgi:hypothetical protein